MSGGCNSHYKTFNKHQWPKAKSTKNACDGTSKSDRFRYRYKAEPKDEPRLRCPSLCSSPLASRLQLQLLEGSIMVSLVAAEGSTALAMCGVCGPGRDGHEALSAQFAKYEVCFRKFAVFGLLAGEQ